MPRYKDEPPAIRVYTVCDKSRYLIVRKVPALGCGDDLLKLFASYGDVEEFLMLQNDASEASSLAYSLQTDNITQQMETEHCLCEDRGEMQHSSQLNNPPLSRVQSDQVAMQIASEVATACRLGLEVTKALRSNAWISCGDGTKYSMHFGCAR